MTGLLIKLFIKNIDPKDPHCREKFGTLSSVCGMICNLLLFAAKLIVGTLSGSIAITADAFNNLSDLGSCCVAVLGMKLAARPADKDHPFGHGRYEYLTTMAVAVVIILVAFELGKSSVEKIIAPTAVSCSWVLVFVLAISILVKLWMFFFNRKLGKTIESGVLKASAKDSINDCISTGVVLVTTVVLSVLDLPAAVAGRIDGAMGLAVAFFILWSGITVIRENLGNLLGEPPSKELVESLYSKIMAYEGVLGIHDMIIHNYGPTRTIATLHVEVSSSEDVMVSHDLIDSIEKDVSEELGLMLTIHMDPVSNDSEKVVSVREKVQKLAGAIETGVTIHDFRMVEGPTHTNLIFDAVLPYESRMKESELKEKLSQAVSAIDETWYTVITVDRKFV